VGGRADPRTRLRPTPAVDAALDGAGHNGLAAGLVWHAYAPYAGVTAIRRAGTFPDGGPFESEALCLFTTTNGRLARLEYFEPDALDVALVRFAALGAA
jgi:hypothetical protein